MAQMVDAKQFENFLRARGVDACPACGFTTDDENPFGVPPSPVALLVLDEQMKPHLTDTFLVTGAAVCPNCGFVGLYDLKTLTHAK
jgi:hypothetical protein